MGIEEVASATFCSILHLQINSLLMARVILSFLILSCFSLSCQKEKSVINPDVNWSLLKKGIVTRNNELIKEEFSKLLTATLPKPINDDYIGHKNNFENIINQINNSHIISAELICYACIETLPAQSEILVSADSSGTTITRILDIITPENSILVYSNIHN